MLGSSSARIDVPSVRGMEGGEGGQGWISAQKVSGLGCTFSMWLMLSGLMIDTVVFSVREGGGEVEVVGGEVKGSRCPRARSLPRGGQLGLGAKEVRIVITGSGVEDLRRVTGVCFI